MLDRLLPIYLFIALGFLLSRSSERVSALTRGISILLVYGLVPVVVVVAFEGLVGLDVGFLSVLIPATLLMYGLSMVLSFAASTRLEMRRSTRGAFLMVNSFPNALYLPFPIVFSFFGVEGIGYSSMIFLVSMLTVMFVGYPLAAYHSQDQGFDSTVRKILGFPGFGAGLVGLTVVLLGIQFPRWLDEPLSLVSQFTLYLALVFVGLNLGRSVDLGNLEGVAVAAVIRLVTVPILMFAILLWSKWVGLWAIVLLINSGMPPAVNNIIYADYFGLDRQMAASAVTALTALSLVTTPLLVYAGGFLTA